jgi:hypothetical protein
MLCEALVTLVDGVHIQQLALPEDSDSRTLLTCRTIFLEEQSLQEASSKPYATVHHSRHTAVSCSVGSQ